MPSLSHAVLSATLSEARPKFFKRRTFEDDQELERREAVKLHLVPRTDEAKVMAERFGSGSPWQWILEHALIRRKLRRFWGVDILGDSHRFVSTTLDARQNGANAGDIVPVAAGRDKRLLAGTA